MEERASRFQPGGDARLSIRRFGSTAAITRGHGILNKMCDLQTFTNFFFPATIIKEQYDLLAETSLKVAAGRFPMHQTCPVVRTAI
ncbi:MAG TPA: hypothetical protein VF845_11605 [Terriglobales bacterium]